MKILFIIDSLRFGGSERRLVELLKGLENFTDIQKELVIMGRQIDYPEVFKTKTTVHVIERKFKKDLSIFARLYQLFKRIDPDLIHNWGSLAAVYAAPCAWLLGRPFLNGMIKDTPPEQKIFHRNWLRAKFSFPFSDYIIANSFAGLKSYHVNHGRGCCVHNGFDFQRIQHLQEPDVIRKKFNLGTEKIVAMVAVFHKRKDYDTFFRAAKKIISANKNVIFLAVGTGPLLDHHQNSIEPQFAPQIRFLGKQNDVESIMNICDIGILTTNQKIHGEGISNSIMEFMALGKPVIATRGGGTEEIIVDNKTGFLIAPCDVKALTEKIDYLLQHRNIAIEFGRNAHIRIKDEFNLNKMVAAFESLYRKVYDSSVSKKSQDKKW